MKSSILKSLTFIFVCIFITACGSQKTLESVMSTDSALTKIDDVRIRLLNEHGDVYCDYKVKVSGNDIVYEYYYIPDYTDEMLDSVKNVLETDTTWSETVNSVKDEIEQTSLIRPDSVTFAYYSSDGREIFKVTE